MNIYDMVLGDVEKPLLEAVMKHVNGNQSNAAKTLGLSCGTLREKLKIYGML
ncbi:MAG: helix-turn-helix domain-containing protein [Gammaproteobacteria bacterium]